MPVQRRKIWIMRHNMEQENEREQAEKLKNGKMSTVDGAALNAYAKMEQSKQKIKDGQLKR